MFVKDDLTVQKELISRRSWLTKGFGAAIALGLGSTALKYSGVLGSDTVEAMNNLAAGGLDYISSDACVLSCQTTEGPCYSNLNLVRRNIASGIAGLPVKFGFRIVNADTCAPISNASLEIWHCDKDGNYSALPVSGPCTNSSATTSQNFGRGIQFTDDDGWCYFDSIFPGWYSGRTTHIHARVKLNNTTMVTTQFLFADHVDETVYRNHPSYTGRPNRDTTNTSDNVMGGNLSRSLPYVLGTKLIQNRFLHATKTIAVRTTATTCNV